MECRKPKVFALGSMLEKVKHEKCKVRKRKNFVCFFYVKCLPISRLLGLGSSR